MNEVLAIVLSPELRALLELLQGIFSVGLGASLVAAAVSALIERKKRKDK
jgi:hypothetical protein